MDAPPAALDPVDAAGYIADMSTELAALAKRSGHEFLGYLLEMAALEARGGLDLNPRSRPPRRR